MQHVKIFLESDDESKILGFRMPWAFDRKPFLFCLSIRIRGLNWASKMTICLNTAIVLCMYFSHKIWQVLLWVLPTPLISFYPLPYWTECTNCVWLILGCLEVFILTVTYTLLIKKHIHSTTKKYICALTLTYKLFYVFDIQIWTRNGEQEPTVLWGDGQLTHYETTPKCTKQGLCVKCWIELK